LIGCPVSGSNSAWPSSHTGIRSVTVWFSVVSATAMPKAIKVPILIANTTRYDITADVVLRANSADRHCAIAASAARRTAMTSRVTIARPMETPPSSRHHTTSGSDTAMNTSAVIHAAASFPTAISAGVISVVCSVASTPRSRSPLMD
jgi:hypothetical protein